MLPQYAMIEGEDDTVRQNIQKHADTEQFQNQCCHNTNTSKISQCSTNFGTIATTVGTI